MYLIVNSIRVDKRIRMILSGKTELSGGRFAPLLRLPPVSIISSKRHIHNHTHTPTNEHNLCKITNYSFT